MDDSMKLEINAYVKRLEVSIKYKKNYFKSIIVLCFVLMIISLLLKLENNILLYLIFVHIVYFFVQYIEVFTIYSPLKKIIYLSQSDELDEFKKHRFILCLSSQYLTWFIKSSYFRTESIEEKNLKEAYKLYVKTVGIVYMGALAIILFSIMFTFIIVININQM